MDVVVCAHVWAFDFAALFVPVMALLNILLILFWSARHSLFSPPSCPSYLFFPLPHFCQPFVVLFPVLFLVWLPPTEIHHYPCLFLSGCWIQVNLYQLRPLTRVPSEYIYVVSLGHPASTCPEWTQPLPLLQTCPQPMALWVVTTYCALARYLEPSPPVVSASWLLVACFYYSSCHVFRFSTFPSILTSVKILSISFPKAE